MKKRRHPLAKEHFMEGTRQKWMAVFLVCAGVVMFMTAYHGIDPMPFMQFLTVTCLTFVIGASASSLMKEYKRGNIEEKMVERDHTESTDGEGYHPTFKEE